MLVLVLLIISCVTVCASSLPEVVLRPWGDANAHDISLQTRIIRLRSISADKFIAELKSAHILEKDAHYIIDKLTNSVWLQADAKILHIISDWQRAVDRAPRQVSIRARIVYIDDNQLRQLGLSVQQTSKQDAGASGGFHIPILHFRDSSTLNAQIDLLQHKGRAKIVASPELLTTKHQVASIASGDEIPYQETTSSGATSATFKKAVMRLAVTPEILSKNYLSLTIALNQDQVSKSLVNGVPAIKTRELKTIVRLHNNQTVVLGGIKQTRSEVSRRGIPILSQIPVLGLLFGQHKNELQQQSLWIILTPHIVSQ